MTATPTARDRAASAFLLGLMACGCVALFTAVPLGVLWGVAQLTDSFATHFVLGLVGIPLAIAALAPCLFWLNGLYLRVKLATMPDDEWDDDGPHERLGGPLEPMLVAAFVVAVVAICVWFFVFAENPVLTA
jgi:ABC-type dipeptide/oligopeptide/nickel transport system permease component